MWLGKHKAMNSGLNMHAEMEAHRGICPQAFKKDRRSACVERLFVSA